MRSLEDIKQTYAWSWLVCHLLEYNPNYRARFRALGQDYLADQQDTFGKRFDPVANELAFEYEFTVDHMAPGYRVDLCAWDWDKRCPLPGRWSANSRASGGGTRVSSFRICWSRPDNPMPTHASGTWTTDAQAGPTSADGAPQGTGRLEAVVMRDFQLSEPILLGRTRQFPAPCDGQLYLRCRDDWNQLGDNDGSIVVTFSRKVEREKPPVNPVRPVSMAACGTQHQPDAFMATAGSLGTRVAAGRREAARSQSRFPADRVPAGRSPIARRIPATRTVAGPVLPPLPTGAGSRHLR